MCGFFGLFTNKKILDSLDVNYNLDLIKHRGPDHSSFLRCNDNVLFAHTRLSILDLSDHGNQPMVSHSSNFTIIYNGEVYNFNDLKLEFNLNFLSSNTDTEVILELFSKILIESVGKLNGMFSFAIRDNVNKKIYLVRDRLGIKPLYYKHTVDGFYFASEIKVVNSLSNSKFAFNISKFNEWLYYGNTLDNETLHSDIFNLEPATILVFDEELNSFDKIKYWSPSVPKNDFSASDIPNLIKKNKFLLEEAVKRQLVSDVPLGVFLSGGIDSTAITAFASKHYDGKLKTFSAGFDFDNGNNELPQASIIAKTYNTEHHELHIKGSDISDIVVKMVHHHDHPFSDAANIPLFLLCENVKGNSKVILQGDGGDELYGGYKRYKTLSNINKMKVLANVGSFINYFSLKNQNYYIRKRYCNALLANYDWKILALLLTVEDEFESPCNIFHPSIRSEIVKYSAFSRYKNLQSLYSNLPLTDQMSLIDSQVILPNIFLEKVDRATMASSVEVRVPFLDNDLVEFAQSIPSSIKIPNGQNKWLLKESLKGIVPHNVLYGPKKGFGVPFGFWLTSSLRDLLFDSVNKANQIYPDTFDVVYLEYLYKSLVNKSKDCSFLLWKVLNMALWLSQNEK